MKRIKRTALSAFIAITMSAYAASSLQVLAERYPLTIVAKQDSPAFAEIRITGALYEWNNSTEQLTAKIDQFIADGVENVKVYVNSPGGDVFVAAEIINQLKRFTGYKLGYGGAIVASAATAIAIELDTFEMAENGQFMYHKPRGYFQGNEDEVESKLALLKNLTSHYRTKYSEKTGLTENEIEANWSKGDVWLTAEKAKEQKFITGVTGKEKVTKTTAEMITAFGGDTPEITSQKEKKEHNLETKMKNRNQIIAALKLPADATDEQIEAAVKEQAEKAGQVEQLTATAEAQREAEIKAFVKQGNIDKKYGADMIPHYEALAKKDFDGTKAIINAMQPLEKPEIKEEGEGATGREKWTMQDWAEKDPEGLKVLMVEKPEDFKKLEEGYF